MDLNANEVLKILKKRSVDALHHANTVRTACTFLQQGRLLARGVVDDLGLTQTPQQSDAVDKKYNLWYDVFLDGIDIHDRARQRCFYGPVLFVLDLTLLTQDRSPSVWITKKNPQNWSDGQVTSERYFSSIEELQRDYRKGKFDYSLLLKTGGTLRLKPYLKRVFVANPHYTASGVQFYSQAVGALKASARFGGINALTIQPRECVKSCKCKSQYKEMSTKALSHFFAP
jgi:hypothetical protein